MNAVRLERVLSSENVDAQINTYLACIEGIGASISELRGLRLLEALKRTAIKAGPYPHVTLFEAANRIMTDLVLLYGVRWLLQSRVFPFSTYVVEYGHEDKNGFDITAEQDGQKLIGEAFNVAPSFFQGKKASMLRKLRTKGEGATYSLLMFNHDAMPAGYVPSNKGKEHHIFVHVGNGRAEMVPNQGRRAE